jgi:hypothetical protein
MPNRRAAVQQSSTDLVRRCKAALSERVRDLNPDSEWIDGFRGYLRHIEDVLLPEITPDLYHAEIDDGAGGELQWSIRNGRNCPPKMQAAYSSSALVVNSFAPWKRQLAGLELYGRSGFSSLRFEVKVPTQLGGTPPHLDFLAEAPDAAAVASESKATEFLQPHRTEFAPSYGSVCWPTCVESYSVIMRRLQLRPSTFAFLDAAQLVKHAFGLSAKFSDREVILLYLFWEPANRDSYREFDRHRDEIAEFAACVTGSSVTFCWKSYPELWADWAQQDDLWLRQHAAKLFERYAVNI